MVDELERWQPQLVDYFHRTHCSINVSYLRDVNSFKLRRSGIIIEITEIKKRKSSEGAIYS